MNKQDIINIIFAVSLIALFIFYMKCNRDNFAVCTPGTYGCYDQNFGTYYDAPPNSTNHAFNVPYGTIQNSVLTSDSNNNLSLITSYDVPIGSIIMWGSTDASTLPTGWLFCDGSTYTEGSSSYTLPNLCGRFIVGAGNAQNAETSSYNVGDVGGEEQHLLDGVEIPPHSHTFPADSNNSHWTGPNAPVWGGLGVNGSANGKTGSTGGIAPHNNLPPYTALAFIVKVSDGPLSGTVTSNGMNNSV